MSLAAFNNFFCSICLVFQRKPDRVGSNSRMSGGKVGGEGDREEGRLQKVSAVEMRVRLGTGFGEEKGARKVCS